MVVDWTTFKAAIDARNIKGQYVETDERYTLILADSWFKLECTLEKLPSDTTDLDDFEAAYKANFNTHLSFLGVVKTTRVPIGPGWSVVPIQATSTCVRFRNAGSDPLHLNTDGDPAQYYTLTMGESSPVIDIAGVTSFQFSTTGSATTLEQLEW